MARYQCCFWIPQAHNLIEKETSNHVATMKMIYSGDVIQMDASIFKGLRKLDTGYVKMDKSDGNYLKLQIIHVI